MNLYFLRHAIAVERGTPGYADDSKRPLTPDGFAKMRLNATGMRTLGVAFDLILSSPYVRAKQTAEIVVDVLNLKQKIIYTTNLAPDVSFEQLIHEIDSHAKKSTNILLVGHEPHLSGLISVLIAGKDAVSIDFKKGGLCKLSIDPPCVAGKATLEWLLTPVQLRHLKTS